jgi:hypothetical protein
MSLFSVNRNVWLWFHILGGGVGAKFFHTAMKMTEQQAIASVFVLAVVWEVYEYLKDDVSAIYGSKKAFFVDAVQDVFGALLMAIVVVL